MKLVDITEMVTNAIEQKILKEWKHEGYIDGMCSDAVSFCIDGKCYTLSIVCLGEEKEIDQ